MAENNSFLRYLVVEMVVEDRKVPRYLVVEKMAYFHNDP